MFPTFRRFTRNIFLRLHQQCLLISVIGCGCMNGLYSFSKVRVFNFHSTWRISQKSSAVHFPVISSKGVWWPLLAGSLFCLFGIGPLVCFNMCDAGEAGCIDWLRTENQLPCRSMLTPGIVFTGDGERDCSDAWTVMVSDSILTGDLSAEIVLRGIFVRKWVSFW